MGQQEDPETENGQTFNKGTEPRWAGGGQPQHKIDTGGFEEWHQLWAFAFHLHKNNRTLKQMHKIYVCKYVNVYHKRVLLFLYEFIITTVSVF